MITFKEHSIKKKFRPLFYVVKALPAVVVALLGLFVVRILPFLTLLLHSLSLLWFDRACNKVNFSKANFSHFILAALGIVLSDPHQKVPLLNEYFSVKTCFQACAYSSKVVFLHLSVFGKFNLRIFIKFGITIHLVAEIIVKGITFCCFELLLFVVQK